MEQRDVDEFAVYIIPEDKDFYALTSEFVGYDIRAEKVIKDAQVIPASLAKKLSTDWGNQYGSHITITDAIDMSEHATKKATRRIRRIVRILRLGTLDLSLNKVGLMPKGEAVAVQYKHNMKLFILHILLLVFVQRLGNQTNYSTNNTFKGWMKLKTYLFKSPYVLDDFRAHISLQYVPDRTSAQTKALEADIEKVFSGHSTLRVSQIVTVYRPKGAANFRIRDSITL